MVEQAKSFLKIGHRGSPAVCPENTFLSFDYALKNGADALELDVQCAADGNLVVIHDDTLERTTNGVGRISDYPLSELRELDAGQGAAIPTLHEVLRRYGLGGDKSPYLFLEVKHESDAEQVAHMVHRHTSTLPSCYQKCVVISFFPEVIDVVRAVDIEILVGLTYDEENYDKYVIVEHLGCYQPDYVNLNTDVLEKSVVDLIHKHGSKVNVWTANDKHTIASSIAAGVDGVMTDDIRLFL